MIKGLFLDRDGVINRMVKYEYGWDSPQREEDVALVEGIEKIILWANERGIVVIEVSNQPGMAKGKMTKMLADKIEETIDSLLLKKEVVIDKKYFCWHHPRAVIEKLKKDCSCRKPKPGMLIEASADLELNLAECAFLGDKASDVMAGKAAGCITIIFLHDEDEEAKVNEAKKAEADYLVDRLADVVGILDQL